MKKLRSESGLRPAGFQKLDGKGQKAYLDKHPTSKYHKIAKDSVKKAVAKDPKFDNIKVAKEKPAESKPKRKDSERLFNKVKADANAEVSTDKRIATFVEQNKRKIGTSLIMGSENLQRNTTKISHAVHQQTTPKTIDTLKGIFSKFKSGLGISGEDLHAVKKVATPLIKIGLGVAVAALLGPAALAVTTIMAAQYATSYDFDKHIDKVLEERAKRKEEEEADRQARINDREAEFSAESNAAANIDGDPIEYMVKDVARWMASIDQEMLGDKIAKLAALQEMESEETDEDEDTDMTSESAVTQRLTYRVATSQTRLSPLLRTMWEIRYGENIIGKIQSDPDVEGNGHENRSWVVTLEDGFDESAFNSGYDSSAPFTTLNKGRLLLRNPARLTMKEARMWASHVIDRSYL